MSDHWEYQFVSFPARTDEQVNATLADWGAHGWEPVHHAVAMDHDGIPTYYSFLFKRRLV
ncbi:hypothetical protein [Streptomyces sp. NPDC049744]|uniref:hypothetical protein n=1 Tax=Streptomyces sp. NPDC049744 TaxID=3154359 RepID=UPI00343C7160